MIESLKAFLNGTAGNPYTRQREAAANREKAEKQVAPRLVWPFRGWFTRLLRWAQETAPMREDSITDMGMGHPLLRRMFAELGERLVGSGALSSAEDIYWLEEGELNTCLENMGNNAPVEDYCGQIEKRKADWKAFIKLSPPVILPEKTGWSKMVHGEDVSKEDGKVVLKGIGTSSGRVTAPACVLTGPEDFSKMKPGDVLVAVTTTPAWTPLFTLASAVVTDIGGPLSHSSIVAREYNIPAVMAARGATRAIQQGQLITVDGATGKVILS
jgi:pyruvate,water dikinase